MNIATTTPLDPLANEGPFQGGKIVIDAERGLVVTGAMSDTEYTQAAHFLHFTSRKLSDNKKTIDRYLGQLILTYAAERETSWADAISRLNLVEDTNRTFRQLMTLPKVVSQLPEEAFGLPNLSMGDLKAAIAYAAPEDPENFRDFSDKRMEILKTVSEHPEDTGRDFIEQRMRALQGEHGIKPRKKESPQAVQLKFMQAALMLIRWTEADYEAFGVTRGQTLDYFEGYRAELVERGILTDDETNPICFCPPWKSLNDNVIEDDPKL